MYLSLKFLASILIKIFEEFPSHMNLWLNSSLIFLLIGILMKTPQLSILDISGFIVSELVVGSGEQDEGNQIELGPAHYLDLVKFIYSEKATKFCEISTVDLTINYIGQIYGGDFAKICGLLRIYEL